MKSYIYLLLFALALPSVPLANAGQAPDPQLEKALQTFEAALLCVPPPYVLVECVPLPGGSLVTKFIKGPTDQIIAQSLAPREWRVSAQGVSLDGLICQVVDNDDFTSKGQGFHPWKRDLSDFCAACVNDPDCLRLP